MRKPRSIAWLLAILMVAGVCLPLTGSAILPPINHNIPPPDGGPPNAPVSPTKKGLFLAVDKTQAVVGDTLTFKATWNGGGRGKSIVLWVFNGKERVKVLHEAPGNRWEYKLEAPGIYKGMAIARDATGRKPLYKDSALVTVTVPVTPPPVTPEPVTPVPVTPVPVTPVPATPVPPTAVPVTPVPPTAVPVTPEPATPVPPTPVPATPEPELEEIDIGGTKTMGLGTLMSIKPIADFTMVEGTTITPIPIEVMAKPEVKNIQVKVQGLKPFLRWSNWYFSLSKPEIRGHIFSQKEPDLYRPFREVEKEDGNKVRLHATNEMLLWNAEELGKTLNITITATGAIGEEKGSVSHSFKIRYLRDANRNGIADIFEQQAKDVLKLSQINDRTVIASEPLNPIDFFAIDSPQVKRPVSYGLPEAPSGLKIRNEKLGEPYTKGVISGKFNINWAEYETSRDVLVKYSGKDQEGHTAQNAFKAKVLRDDNKDGLPDRVLSIEPIPSQTVIVGGKLHVPITVRSNLGGDIKLSVYRAWMGKSDSSTKIYLTSPKYENASLKPVPGPLHGPNPEDKLYHFLYSSDSWCSNYRESLNDDASGWVIFSVRARSGDYEVESSFDLLFFDPKGSDPKINYQFVPVADSRWTELDNVFIKLQLNKMEEGITFRTGPLPPGLYLDPSIPAILGEFDIRDWQPWETQRRFPITAYALYKADGNKKYGLGDKEMVAVTSFHVTVQCMLLSLEDADKPKAIPDQTVINQLPIIPIHVTCDKSLHTLQITDIKGLPPGNIHFGPGNFIEGKAEVNDWGENEAMREFPVTVVTHCEQPPTPHPEGVPTVSIASTDETHFTIRVLRKRPEGWSSGDPLPQIMITYTQNRHQQTHEGEPIKPIVINTWMKGDSPPKYLFSGLPEGISQGPDNTPTGTPIIGDWASGETMRAIEMSVRVENPAGDADSDRLIIDVYRNEAEIPPTVDEPPIPDPGEEKTTPDLPEDVPEDVPVDVPVDIPEDAPEGEIPIPPPPPPPPPPEPPKRLVIKEGLSIAILHSEETGEQQSLLQGALGGLIQAGYEIDKNLSLDYFQLWDAQFDPELLTQKTYALAITLGQQALATAQEKLAAGIPLVVLGVENPVLTRPATGVSPDVSANELLDHILGIQPEAKAIAYLYTDKAGPLEALTTLANELGLSVQSAAAPDAAQYAQEGLKLLEGADLLILAQTPAQEEALKPLMEGAGKPLYVTQPDLIYQGATVSLYAEAYDMGLQGGWLAARILSGEDVNTLPFEAARNIKIGYNPQAMVNLGLFPPFGALPLFPN